MCFFVDPGIIPKNHPDFCPKENPKEEALEEKKKEKNIENKMVILEMVEGQDNNKEKIENESNEKNLKENLQLDINRIEDGKKGEMLIEKDDIANKDGIESKKSFEKNLNESLEVSITIKANIPNIYK